MNCNCPTCGSPQWPVGRLFKTRFFVDTLVEQEKHIVCKSCGTEFDVLFKPEGSKTEYKKAYFSNIIHHSQSDSEGQAK